MDSIILGQRVVLRSWYKGHELAGDNKKSKKVVLAFGPKQEATFYGNWTQSSSLIAQPHKFGLQHRVLTTFNDATAKLEMAMK